MPPKSDSAVIRYFDSSALVKRYFVETGSAWIQSVCADVDRIIALAEIGLVEITAAMAGKLRGGYISASQFRVLRSDIEADIKHEYVLVSIDRSIVNHAMDLTTRHRLRGYDAVHLACALYLQQSLTARQLAPLTFISADKDLLQAALAEGLLVDDPNQH